MHSGDVADKLVADGYASEMRPWTCKEFVVIGPEADPAGVKGVTNGVEAFKRIGRKQANFLVNDGVGAGELSQKLWHDAGIRPRGAWLLFNDDGLDEVELAGAKQAYTVVNRRPGLAEELARRKLRVVCEPLDRVCPIGRMALT